LLGYLQHGHVQEPETVKTASLAELEGDLPLAGAMKLNGIKHP
jgi:phosphohistidine phosphatase